MTPHALKRLFGPAETQLWMGPACGAMAPHVQSMQLTPLVMSFNPLHVLTIYTQ